MIPRYARPLFVSLALVAGLGTLHACKPLRPAGIVAPPWNAAAAWDEDLWIIAKRAPSEHRTAESEALFPLAAPSHSHPGPRSSNDIALSVDIEAGMPIETVHSL